MPFPTVSSLPAAVIISLTLPTREKGPCSMPVYKLATTRLFSADIQMELTKSKNSLFSYWVSGHSQSNKRDGAEGGIARQAPWLDRRHGGGEHNHEEHHGAASERILCCVRPLR